MNRRTVPFNNLRFSPEVIRKLKSYQERERDGNTIDYRTPFDSRPHGSGINPIPNTRISGVDGRVAPDRMDVFRSMEKAGVINALSDEHGDVLKFELSFQNKVQSSRSLRLPWADRLEKMLEYYKVPNFNVDEVTYKKAVKMVEHMIRKYIPNASLRPLSMEAAKDSLPTTTNWGAPYFLEGKVYRYDEDKKITSETDNRHKYMIAAERIVNAIRNKEEPKPEDIAFWILWRGQEGPDQTTKQRIVCGEAHGVSIIGSRLRPFIDAESRLPWRKALVSQEEVDKHIADAFKTFKGQSLYGFDGEGYDFHLHSALMHSAADIILGSFTLTKEDRYLMEWYFKTHILTSPFLTPDGLVFGRNHNMPSGTIFTNTIDSITQMIATQYCALKMNKPLHIIQVQGDDGVYVLTGLDKIELDKLSATYAELGFVVNLEKQWLETDSVTYLKRIHVSNRQSSFRSYTWVMIGLCNMERPRGWKDAMYSARAITQTSNLSPEFSGYNAFMKWASERDFYGLGIKLKEGSLGVLRAAGGATKVAERLGFDSFAANQQGLKTNHGKVSIIVPDLNTAKWVAQQKGNA